MSDEDIIPLLHQLGSVTYFTLDRDYYQQHLCHLRYCLVWLDIDEELRVEGWAREIVHAVQAARRDAGLEITDRIALTLDGDETLIDAARAHQEFIAGETLATEVSYENLDRYFVEQANKPQTIAYGLADSPAGQAAWLYDIYGNTASDGKASEGVAIGADVHQAEMLPIEHDQAGT